MAQMFDIIVENAVLNAKSTILEEAAGTPAGERYVYIVEAAGDVIKKAKDFVVKNKGKLAALAALGAAGAYAHSQGHFAKPAQAAADALSKYARDQRLTKGEGTVWDVISKGYDDARDAISKFF